MFQHTLDRATQLSRPEHTLAVIARAHRETVLAQLAGRASIGLLAQPINRDTAVGILLAVTHVYTHDPEAMVVVFPSDHFVSPEQQFLSAVRSAVTAAGQLKDQLVLLGVVPDGLDLDYGWITQGQELGRVGGHTVRSVRAFVEKPDLPEAERVRAAGALWNTMVVAGRAATLWALARKHLAELMPHFDRLRQAIGTPHEARVLHSIYEVLPPRNFSSHVLEKAWATVAVLPLEGVLWSDWGRPERIMQTLNQIGMQNHVPGPI